jgi:YegS/Rv2252/BmrU family lipid kinase
MVEEESPLLGGPTVLLINALSRRGGRAARIVAAALERQGLELSGVVRVRRPRRLGLVVEGLRDQGVGRLIVGGGDGTLGTVATRLAESKVVLGVIPLGTANDFARTLGIPGHLPTAAAIAAGTNIRAIDMARANDAFFLNVASIGMSAQLTVLLSAGMKRWLGPTAYLIAGARAFARHPTFRARISSPAGVTERLVHQVVVANGRYFGGGILADHEGTLDDGVLAVYTLGTRSRWDLLRTMALLRFRMPHHRPGDIFLRTTAVRVETEPAGKPVNLDGELRTTTPVSFTVVPRALRVLVPPASHDI